MMDCIVLRDSEEDPDSLIADARALERDCCDKALLSSERESALARPWDSSLLDKELSERMECKEDSILRAQLREWSTKARSSDEAS